MLIFGSPIWDAHPGHANCMAIVNVGHSGSLITTHYQESTRCCYKIKNINSLNIIPWISYLNISRKRPDTNQQKIKGVSGIDQNLKSYVNSLWENNRSSGCQSWGGGGRSP